MTDHLYHLGYMICAARAAGIGLRRDFQNLSSLTIRTKEGPSDMVSAADERAELTCREFLARAFPDIAFIGEETASGDEAPDGYAWLVDPLDGTTNFLFGSPLWGVNVALALDGKVVAGVTYIPELDEMYSAELGGGTNLNGKPIRVSKRNKLEECLLSCGMPFLTKHRHQEFAREMQQFSPNVAGIRRTGACAVDMAWVASGRWDAYWERETNAWDMAAGAILVSEAGGSVSDVNGEPFDVFDKNICVSNGHIHDSIIENLRTASIGCRGNHETI